MYQNQITTTLLNLCLQPVLQPLKFPFFFGVSLVRPLGVFETLFGVLVLGVFEKLIRGVFFEDDDLFIDPLKIMIN